MRVPQPKLILASGSPRRAEILGAVGWEFERIVEGIDEAVLPGETATEYVRRLARAKAETVAARLSNALVLGADTTVVVDDQILGQPVDGEDAARMLRLLSGKWHDVLTGVALIKVANGEATALVESQATRVRFAELSAADIEWYVESGETAGKAGAYGVQGKAALLIEEIQGEYFNVVGLPIRLVHKMVKKMI